MKKLCICLTLTFLSAGTLRAEWRHTELYTLAHEAFSSLPLGIRVPAMRFVVSDDVRDLDEAGIAAQALADNPELKLLPDPGRLDAHGVASIIAYDASLNDISYSAKKMALLSEKLDPFLSRPENKEAADKFDRATEASMRALPKNLEYKIGEILRDYRERLQEDRGRAYAN